MALKIKIESLQLVCLRCRGVFREPVIASKTNPCHCRDEYSPDVAVVYRDGVYKDVWVDEDGLYIAAIYKGTVEEWGL